MNYIKPKADVIEMHTRDVITESGSLNPIEEGIDITNQTWGDGMVI